MSKSILVVDTPETCLDCGFCRELDEGVKACCELSNEPKDSELYRTIETDYCQDKPEWCPLKELPKKIVEENRWFSRDYAQGWNACTDMILLGIGAKMNAEEAIRILTDKHTSIGTLKCDDTEWKKLRPAIDAAVAALEKQTPKKRIDGKLHKTLGYYQCPVCGCLLEKNKCFCETCGQAIDWSE